MRPCRSVAILDRDCSICDEEQQATTDKNGLGLPHRSCYDNFLTQINILCSSLTCVPRVRCGRSAPFDLRRARIRSRLKRGKCGGSIVSARKRLRSFHLSRSRKNLASVTKTKFQSGDFCRTCVKQSPMSSLSASRLCYSLHMFRRLPLNADQTQDVGNRGAPGVLPRWGKKGQGLVSVFGILDIFVNQIQRTFL